MSLNCRSNPFPCPSPEAAFETAASRGRPLPSTLAHLEEEGKEGGKGGGEAERANERTSDLGSSSSFSFPRLYLPFLCPFHVASPPHTEHLIAFVRLTQWWANFFDEGPHLRYQRGPRAALIESPGGVGSAYFL